MIDLGFVVDLLDSEGVDPRGHLLSMTCILEDLNTGFYFPMAI
jgi:hypothetical protein